MRKVFIALLFLVMPFILPKDVSAQVCGGMQTCCPAGGLREECTYPDGFTLCFKGAPGCTCQVTCNDVSENCSFRGAAGCSTSWLSGDCAYLYGSCGVSGGGGPVCNNNDTCDFGESNANCPHDCLPSSTPPPPPPGVCTTGDPFTGINNCGEVGRQNGSGSCGPGCLCCAFNPPVTASCTVVNSVPPRLTIRVGEVAQVKVNVRGNNTGPATWGGITMSTNPVGLGTPGIASVSPTSVNMCCGSANGYLFAPTDTRGTLSVTGLAPGSTNLSVFATTSLNFVNCIGYTQISVLPVANVPSLNLTINGVANSATLPAAGGNVALNWTSNDVTTCSASDDWSGSKPIVGPEAQGFVTTPKLYTLTCDGPDGQVTDSVIANITGVSGLPRVDLRGGGAGYSSGTDGPLLVNIGQGVRVSWNNLNIDRTRGCDKTSSPVDPRWNTNPNPVTGLPASGGSLAFADVAPTAPTTYTMTCFQNGNLAVSSSDSILINTRSQCGDPVDLAPQMVCSPDGIQNGVIKWQWEAVPFANEYSVTIKNQLGNTVFTTLPTTPTGFQNAGTFGCSYTTTQNPADICSISTFLPPGSPINRYHAEISVRSTANSCTALTGTVTPEYSVPTCAVTSWWQSGSGSIVTQGSISSTIPSAGISLIQNGVGGSPGIAFGGSGDSIATGNGRISSTNWSVLAPFTGRQPDYDSFVSLIPVSITIADPGGSCGGGTFNSGGATTGDGYSWYRHNGNVNITTDVNLNPGRKVILFVDGDLTIGGKITMTNPRTSFFMALSKGDTTVSPAVVGAVGTPTLTGVFYCGGRFRTGAASTPLNILGSVVANGGVDLQRDLGVAGNGTSPSESFSVSPDMCNNYPPTLTFKRPIWREVTP